MSLDLPLFIISKEEVVCYLDTEELISLYLVSRECREKLEASIHSRPHAKHHSFSDFIMASYKYNVSLNSYKHCGINKCFVRACTTGNITVVRDLLQRGATWHSKGLVAACDAGHFDIVMILYKYVMDVQQVHRAIVGAVSNGNLEIVKFMVEVMFGRTLAVVDIIPDTYDSCINAYLKVAAMRNHLHVIQWLLEIKINPNSGLLGAARGGRLAVTKMMLDLGANNYNEALSCAAIGGNIKIFKLLISKGATNCSQVLCDAAEGGNIKIFKMVIDAGATNYREAMKCAARGGHLEVVRLMLNRGEVVYVEDAEEAALHGHLEVIRLMSGDNLRCNTKIYSVLKHAAQGGHIHIIKAMLFPNGTYISLVYPNILNNIAITAATYGHTDIVLMMLDLGANDYNSYMICAATGGHFDIVRLMLKRGADCYKTVLDNVPSDGIHPDINALMISRSWWPTLYGYVYG